MDSLRNKKEFDFVYRNSKRKYTKGFTLYLMKLDKKSFLCQNRVLGSGFLLGLSISKKIGKATRRNLIKRRIRFVCRRHFEKLKNHSMIFVAKDGILKLSFEELEQDFLSCLRGVFHLGHSTNY